MSAQQKEVPWSTRQAWWGILGLIGLAIIFLFIISALINFQVVKLPAPVAIGLITALLYAGIVGLLYYLTGGRFNTLAFKFPFFKNSGRIVSFIVVCIFVFLSFIGVYVFEAIWILFLRLIGIAAPDTAGPVTDLFGVSTIGFIVIFIVTVIIAPIVEEMFFRSFLYQAFRKQYGVALGILISALLFGLFHFSFLEVLPVFIVMGIFLGYVFEKFHSVYPAIMLHALNNFFFFIVLVLTRR